MQAGQNFSAIVMSDNRYAAPRHKANHSLPSLTVRTRNRGKRKAFGVYFSDFRYTRANQPAC